MFNSLEEMIAAVAPTVHSQERLTVAEAAEKYRFINNPGSYVGMWDNDFAPYLVEPMEVLTSLDFTGMVFAGPARTGKSDMFFNWLTHTSVTDPADMMIVHMTQTVARDWSQKDLRRAFRNTDALGRTVMPGRNNQSTHDIRFKNGMHLLVKWPTVSELSGKTVKYNWIADYDRIADDIEGEGNAFGLTRARATTFKRRGMTVAESSPGRDVSDVKWLPPSPDSHMAPPCGGILDLYNSGDRRRWYWRCPQCNDPFEPDFKLLSWPDTDDPLEAGERVVMVCPHCGGFIHHDANDAAGLPGKYEMNIGGRWLREGEIWLPDGSLGGNPRRAEIASFWLKGPAAAFADWKKLVVDYKMAMDAYERSGDEGPLRVTVNTGQGLPYSPKILSAGRNPEDVKALARDIGDRVVPRGVRFLVATVDVQAGARSSFVVQVHGFSRSGNIVVIDRFSIKKSERLDEDGERHRLRPDAFLEDWDTLIHQVLLRSYPLGDDSGRRMSIKAVACDSGGKEGVTSNAYNFWRRLRDSDGEEFPANLHRRFHLVKGSSQKTDPRVRLSYPDSERKDRHAGARGEIPVLMLNGDLLKDYVDTLLGGKQDDGTIVGGRIVFASWLPDWFYSEVCAETKTEKGWQNLAKLKNEALDLLCYAIAVAVYRPIFWERIDWDNPEGWAEDWDDNDLVFDEGGKTIDEGQEEDDTELEDLGRLLA